jgi:GNAT superfamily N-acetyltransferase
MVPPNIQLETSEVELPAQRDQFAEARGAPFETSLSHWVMHWRESGWVPRWFRPRLGNLIAKFLSRRISLPHGLSFAASWTWRDCGREREDLFRRHWSTLKLPLPVEWLRLGHGFQEPFALRVHNVSGKALSLVLLFTQSGEELAYASRTVVLGTPDGHVQAHYFVVAPKFRNKAVGAQFMANSLVLYRRLGVRSVRIIAGLTTGGAVWAKFGYRPVDDAEWRRVKRVIRSNFRNLLRSTDVGNLYNLLAGQDFEEAMMTILDFDDPTGIWMVTSLDPEGVIAGAAGLDCPGGLAGALLQRSRWRGILDLEDPLALKKTLNYLLKKISFGDVIPPPGW